ncbi:hypothetical protein KFL_001060090 [Klebsormidium nitens]|uniref:Uncharacterized protein n=1 Tax=Klebsormidium nitens TaxID=105231 RepID=A0A1Y1I0G4_KLENI|nr:hypothetical protein KFL_001060090 [Klebsormidium nitens]|eukprot:GAQ82277.1 hypothetical protein KFL_001060090 [Klebsormidium nitens]
MEETEACWEGLERFMEWAMVHPDLVAVFGKGGLRRIVAARLHSSSEPIVHEFAEHCRSTLKAKLVEERSLAWQQSWTLPNIPRSEEEEQTWVQSAPNCMPVLRAEFNIRIFEWLYGESLPKFAFDFESDEYEERDWFTMQSPARLLAELEVLAKIIRKPAQWIFENTLDEISVRDGQGPGFATVHLLGLYAPGHQLVGNHNEVLSSMQEAGLGPADLMPLRETVLADLQLVSEIVVEKDLRYANQFDMFPGLEQVAGYQFGLRRHEGSIPFALDQHL